MTPPAHLLRAHLEAPDRHALARLPAHRNRRPCARRGTPAAAVTVLERQDRPLPAASGGADTITEEDWHKEPPPAELLADPIMQQLMRSDGIDVAAFDDQRPRSRCAALRKVDDATDAERTALDSLIARSAQGDQRAFAALYEATSAKLFGVALRIVKQRELAEDVLQESFVAVWRKAPKFDHTRGQAMTWLTTIVRHRAIDQLRHRNARVEGHAQPDDVLETMAADETSRADRGAELGAIGRSLEVLEPQARQAVLLAYLHGYSHQDLATRLGAPVGTVKSWIRRGLRRLKRGLDG